MQKLHKAAAIIESNGNRQVQMDAVITASQTRSAEAIAPYCNERFFVHLPCNNYRNPLCTGAAAPLWFYRCAFICRFFNSFPGAVIKRFN